MNNSAKGIAIKVVAYQLIFLVVHYIYDWFPNSVTHLFGATDESIFQHMKAGFYALILLVLMEYLVARKRIPFFSRFIYARVFSALLIPLLMFIYFMTSPAFFVKIENIPVEIVFANLVLIATSLSTFLIERHMEQFEPAPGLKIALVAMFVLFLFEFVIFNYRLPWFDVFANPPGW